MSVFVDTSAFIAVLVAEDQNHHSASCIWLELLNKEELVLTSNYIVVETCALLQRRIGIHALKIFIEEILPVVRVEWVDQSLHNAGISGLMMSGRNGPNVVDCVNFSILRKLTIRDVFTYDKHFSESGFVVLPGF